MPTSQEKKPGLRVQIYRLIKEKRGNKVHSGEIEDFGRSLGYKASHADRRARDLVERYHKVKGLDKLSPYFSPNIKHTKENGSTVYWYEEPQKQNPASIFKCSCCPKDAVKYLGNEPRCPQHLSMVEVNQLGLF